MFVQMAKDFFFRLQERKAGSFAQRTNKINRCCHRQQVATSWPQAIEMLKMNAYTKGYDLQAEELDLLVAGTNRGAYKRVRRVLAAENLSTLWTALDFTRRIFGHPKRIGAMFSICDRDHCQCFPLRHCFACGGVSDNMQKICSSWFGW